MEGLTLLGRYRIEGEIGHGGKGIVYKAEDLFLKREVAIKAILPRSSDLDAPRRFQREARITARLEHPAIASVYDFGEHSGQLFLVMPLIRGATLRNMIDAGDLVPPEIYEIALQAAEALEYSHGKNVVHRDVKPENIMVEERSARRPRVKVLDFGLAVRPDEDSKHASDAIYGTVLYISPEQLLGESVDQRTDIYSLGMVIYECLSGRHPFRNGKESIFERVLLWQPPSLRDQGLPISEAVDQMVLSCLAKEPADRPECLREVIRVLLQERQNSEPGSDEDTAAVALTAPGTTANVPGIDPVATTQEPPVVRPTVFEEVVAVTYVDRLGDLLMVQGEYVEAREAYRQARESRKLVEGALLPSTEAHYLLKLAQLEAKLGSYDAALERCRRGVELIAESDSLRSASLAAFAGLVCCMGGRLNEAESWLESGRARLREAALQGRAIRSMEVALLRTEGNLLIESGQPCEAVLIYRRSLELSMQTDDRWEQSIGLFNLGEAYLECKDLVAAADYLRRASDEKSAIGDRWGLAYVHHALARLHLARGETGAALEQAEHGLRLAVEVADPKITSRLRSVLGWSLLEGGDSERATSEFRAALKDAEQIASTPDAAEARRGLEAIWKDLGIDTV